MIRRAFPKGNFALRMIRRAFGKGNFALRMIRRAFLKGNFALRMIRRAFPKGNFAFRMILRTFRFCLQIIALIWHTIPIMARPKRQSQKSIKKGEKL
jgi:hypothetical protein